MPLYAVSTLRRKPRSARQRFEDERTRLRHHSISQPGECFGKFIPWRVERINQEAKKAGLSVNKYLTNKYWAFLKE